MRSNLLNLALLAAFASTPLLATAADQTINVQFPRGGTGKAFDGRVRGYDIVTYTLRASAGQTMAVTLSSQNTGVNFLVVAPDGEAPMFNSASDGESFERTLEDSGVYKIKVSLMRNQARRGTTASYTIDFNVSGGASAAAPSRGNSNAYEEPSVNPVDYVNGKGPSHWQVSGLNNPRKDVLNIRTTASARAALIGELNEGDVVQNLGCKNANDQVWCRIKVLDGSQLTGWVNNAYLTESNGPGR